MLKAQTAFVVLWLAIGSSVAALAEETKPQIKASELPTNNTNTQQTPAQHIPTPQEITEAVTNGITRAAQEYQANYRAPPPDNSNWWFNLFLVIFTGGLVVVGTGQCFLIFGTLRATTTAAEATKNAAETSREALIKSQRAFIRSIGFPWLWRPDFSRPGKYFYDITPIIENAGATPTVDMTIIVDSILRDAPIPDGFDFPYRDRPGITLIGPRQTIGTNNTIILDEDLLAVQNGEKFFYLYGTITYRDVFNGTPVHNTEYCTQITRVLGNPLDPSDPAIGPKATSVEITFGIYKEHNRTD
jgi:hypothetical protein